MSRQLCSPRHPHPAQLRCVAALRAAVEACEELSEVLEGHDCDAHTEGSRSSPYCYACSVLDDVTHIPYTVASYADNLANEIVPTDAAEAIIAHLIARLSEDEDEPEPEPIVVEIDR